MEILIDFIERFVAENNEDFKKWQREKHESKNGVKETGACLFAAALVGMTAFAVAYEPETTVVEYRHEVQSGETLWKVCADVATDAEDLSELVYRTQVENNLSDAQLSCLTPGTEIIIHPKRMVKP